MSSLLSSVFIKDLPNCYYVSPLPFYCHVEWNWSFTDHLSRALPTENIFNLLQSICQKSLEPSEFEPSEFEPSELKVIIKWLEVSFRKCNRHLETPQTNNPICSRDLVPSDRSTCTLAS